MKSWQKFIHNSLQNLNLTTCSLILNKISQLLTDQQCLIDFYSTMLYALIVHNFLYFPKAPDPIKENHSLGINT
jgi:hypothetical protein